MCEARERTFEVVCSHQNVSCVASSVSSEAPNSTFLSLIIVCFLCMIGIEDGVLLAFVSILA